MALTELEQLLIDGLKISGVAKDEAVATMMFLQEEEEQKKLLFFIADHPKATEQDIMEKVFEIVKRQNRTEN